jgi:hypothetical protein
VSAAVAPRHTAREPREEWRAQNAVARTSPPMPLITACDTKPKIPPNTREMRILLNKAQMPYSA